MLVAAEAPSEAARRAQVCEIGLQAQQALGGRELAEAVRLLRRLNAEVNAAKHVWPQAHEEAAEEELAVQTGRPRRAPRGPHGGRTAGGPGFDDQGKVTGTPPGARPGRTPREPIPGPRLVG